MKIVTILCLVFTLTPALLAQQEWWEGNVIFGSFPLADSSNAPPAEVGGTTIEIAGDEATLLEEQALVLAANGYFTSNVSVFNARNSTYIARPELVSAAIIDIYGDPMYVPWESTDTEKLWWGNTNDPIWQQYLTEQLQHLVDANVDAILLDEIEGTPGSMSRGGSFAEEDMAGFRTYLKNKYTDQYMQDWFGVDDPDTLHYGDYLIANGWDEAYLQQEDWIPMYQDFILYQRQSSKQFISDLITETHAYADAQGVERPAMTGNIFGFAPHLMLYADQLDFLVVEYPYVEDGLAPWGHAVPMLKMGNATGNRSVLFPSVFTARSLYLWPDTRDLFSLWIMEAYSTGNAFKHKERFFAGSDFSGQRNWLRPDTTHTREIFDFVANNSYAFGQQEAIADVALAYSFASDFYNDTKQEFLGFAYALSDAHIQYDVIYMGDDQNIADTTTLNDLEQFSAIILPSSHLLTDEQITMLTDYVANGGMLITHPEAGQLDELDNDTSRSSWQSLVALGQRSYSSGQVLSLEEGYGVIYINERTAELRGLLTNPLLNHADALTTTDAPQSLHLVLNEVPDVDGSGNTAYALHALNYNYSQYTYAAWETEPFEISAKLDPANIDGNTQLYHLSRSADAFILLSYSAAVDGTTTFTAPTQNVHSTFFFINQTIAQQLADNADSLSQSDYNDALQRANDENRDSSELTALYNAQQDAYSASNYLEAKRIGLELLQAVDDLFRGRVLFDESLDPRNTLSAQRALELSANNPERRQFIALAQKLDNEFAFTRNTQSPITDTMLASYDILMLPAPTNDLLPEEITAIQDFLSGGGALILLGDANYGWSNGLTESMGISLNGEILSDEEGAAFGNVTIHPDSSTHPSLADAPSEALMSYGGSLEVSQPVEAVLFSDAVTWEDANKNQTRDDAEATGPFPVGAATTHGDGRVFVLSDNSFNDSVLDYTSNAQLMRSILNWLYTGEETTQLTQEYQSWSTDYFGSDTEEPTLKNTVWGPTANPDSDPNKNYFEYVTGSDPLTPGNVEPHVEPAGSGVLLTLPWADRESEQQVQVLHSPDLEAWAVIKTVLAANHLQSSAQGTQLAIMVNQPEGFFRLNIPVLTE